MDRTRTWPAVLLAGLALGALAWWGLERGRERGAAQAPAEVPGPLREAALVAPPSPAAEASASDARAPASDARAPTPKAEAPAPRASEEEPVDLFELEVVDGVSGTPLEGIDVRCKSADAAPRYPGELVREVEDYATRARTDGSGLARFSMPRSKWLWVFASGPGRLGQDAYGPPPSEERGPRRARLELLADWDLEVEVVDARLVPAAGVHVGYAGPGGWSEGGRTDRRGRVRFEHAGFALEQEPARELRLWASILAEEKPEARVQHQPPNGEPVRFVLPPLGAVEVAVLRPDGTPATDDVHVELRTMRPGFTTEVSATERLSDGLAVFEHVGLGLELALEAVARGKLELVREVLAGPRAPGERVRRTVQLALENTMLIFRALDERGQPLPGRLFVTVRDPARRLTTGRGWQVTADHAGRFEVVLEEPLAAEARELEVTARDRALSARVALDHAYPGGRVEMGDVVLYPLPSLASGRVVDQRGGAVAEAQVFASVPFVSPRTGEPSYRRLMESETTTDASGAFCLRGAVDGGLLRVQIGHERVRADPLDVRVGATGLVIVARATGGVAGQVLVEPGLAGYLDITIRPDGEPMSSTGWPTARERRGAQQQEGEFRFDGMLPGRYTLAVHLGRDEPLVEIPGIAVVADEISRDPRIQQLDLRGRLRVFTLDLLPPSPGFELSGGISYTAAGTSAPEHVRGLGPPRRGPVLGVKLVTPLPRIDLTLRLRGCRVERLLDLEAHSEIQLRAGHPVRLVLPSNVELPAPPLFLALELHGVETSLHSDLVNLDEHGEARLFAPEAQTMEVRWYVERRGRDSMSCTTLTQMPARVVEILDGEEEQRFVLQVTNEELQAALAAR